MSFMNFILKLFGKVDSHATGFQHLENGRQPTDCRRLHPFASQRERAISDFRRVEMFVKEMSAQRSGDPDSSTRDQIRKIIECAKKSNLLWDKQRLASLGTSITKRTGESIVYWNKNENAFYKVKNPIAKAEIKKTTPNDWFFEHIIHNILFPQTAYEFLGVAEEFHELRIILKQPAISTERFPSQQQIVNYLENRFHLKLEDRYFFGNEVLAITDISEHSDNVLLGDDGELYFIDPLIRLKCPALKVIEYLVGEHFPCV